MITVRDLIVTGEAYSSYRISSVVARRSEHGGEAAAESSGSNLPARGARGRASRPVWPAAAGVGHTVAHEAAPRRAGSLGPSGAAPVTPFEDLHSYIAIPRVTGLRLSPDGTWLAATVQQPDPDGKKYSTSIWRIPADGGPPPAGASAQPIRLTQSAQGEDGPAFLPDGSLLFVSRRPDPAAGSADGTGRGAGRRQTRAVAAARGRRRRPPDRRPAGRCQPDRHRPRRPRPDVHLPAAAGGGRAGR